FRRRSPRAIDPAGMPEYAWRTAHLRGQMGGKTLTRADLSDAVHQQVGLSRSESAELVKSVLDHMTESLVEGDTVKLSSFGAFTVRRKGGRIGRNPKTGEEVPITPRRVLVFRPSHVLKNLINDGAARDKGG